ncbi:hypothetical protein [Streptomyces sp. NPDC005799]|uniref:hypothetical protein n=1 Tax=Streptomyces sp. NPDC005799 TaxID=3154678 RepID=UPI0033E8FA69
MDGNDLDVAQYPAERVTARDDAGAGGLPPHAMHDVVRIESQLRDRVRAAFGSLSYLSAMPGAVPVAPMEEAG